MKKNADNAVTIKDIAALCGVSISTVSNVLNGKTNKVSKDVSQKILDIVEETGYRPNYMAKNLRAQSTKTIGVIAEDLYMFSTSPMIEGLMRHCEEKGYDVVIENMRLFGRWDDRWMQDDSLFQSALEPVLRKMDALKVDGIVYISSYEHIVNFRYDSGEVPLVFVYATNGDNKTPSFRLDDEMGGYLSYNYLLQKGHKRIGIITGEAESPHTVNRLRGIQRAMFEAGVLFDPSIVEYQAWNKEGGYNGAKKMEDSNVTALLCLSDQIATGVYEYLLENGRKPGTDISVIGYDNRDIAEMLFPPLTTIELPLIDMGYEAVVRLIRMIEGDSDIEKEIDIRIAGAVVERESVSQPKPK